MTPSVMTVLSEDESCGSTTLKKVRISPAPSIFAASMMESEISFMLALKIIMPEPMHDQMTTITMILKLRNGSPSQALFMDARPTF